LNSAVEETKIRAMPRARVIGVVGAGGAVDEPVRQLAERVGELLAARGCIVLTGGREGVMAAASAGARRAGGRVVGILPGVDPAEANADVEIALATGLGEARNAVIATAAAALIAVGGEYGTLSEVALALKLGKPVVTLASPWSTIPGTAPARDAEEAVELALERL
jgi:hypothetical protein